MSYIRHHDEQVFEQHVNCEFTQLLLYQEGKPRVYDNEEDGVAYSYSFFHFMFMIAVFYLMLVLTDWWNADPTEEGLKSSSFSKTSLWVKITSSWICYLIYCWTLVAPAIFPDRDFGYT